MGLSPDTKQAAVTPWWRGLRHTQHPAWLRVGQGGKQGTQCYGAHCEGSPSCLVQRGCEDEALRGLERWLPPSSAGREELPARGKVLPASSGAASGSAAVKLSHCPRLREAENPGQLFTGACEEPALAPGPSLPGLPQPLCSLPVPP